MIFRRQGGNPFIGVIILIFVLVMIWLAISAVRGIFVILSWLALPLFILALVLNYQVVTDYFKWLWKTLKEDTVKGIIYTGLSLLAYPFVSAYLAFKAFSNNRWSSSTSDEDVKGSYIKYKEVEVVEEDDFLDLPELEELKESKKKNQKPGNDYDEMF